MKMYKNYRNLLYALSILLVAFSCKKSDEVTPASLTGKWKQNGINGKIIVKQGTQTASQDINEPADNSIIEFKSDGTALIDGDVTKYTLSGTNLTIGEGNQSVTFTAKVSGSNLTLGFTKDQFFAYLSLLGDANDPNIQSLVAVKNSITEFTYNINYVKQ